MEVVVTKENFENEVLKSEVPVVLDFWATWCGPCRMIAPELQKLDGDMEGKIKIGKVNVDEQEFLAVKFGIEVIPTLVLIEGGEEKKRVSGYYSANDLKEKLLK